MSERFTASAPQHGIRTVGMMTPAWPPGSRPNGIVTATGILRDAFNAQGVTLKVLTGNVEPGTEDPDVVNLRTLHDPSYRRKPLERLRARVFPGHTQARHVALGLTAGLRHVGLDSLDIVEMEESFGAPVLVQKAVPCPVVVRLHGPWFLNGEALGHRRDAVFERRVAWEGRAIQAAEGITSPSQDTLDRTCREYGFSPRRAVVIPYPQALAPESDHWNLDACDRDLILFIGRFDRHKGGDVMIDAFARVAAAHPTAKLRFVGPDRGFLDDAGRKWTLEDYVADRLTDAGAAARFEYLGQQPHEALAKLRQEAFITVAPSRYETFGYTAAEAMSQGCPLIAGDGGGLGEVVRAGYSGLKFRPGDAGELAVQLEVLLRDPAYAAELGRNALEDCADRFAPDVIVRQTIDFYAEVIAARKDGTRHA